MHEIKIPSGDILAEDELTVQYSHDPADPTTGAVEMVGVEKVFWRGVEITGVLRGTEAEDIRAAILNGKGEPDFISEIRQSFLDTQEVFMKNHVQNLPNS